MDRFRDLEQASRALEATLIKQLLESSRAFRGTESAGSHLNAGLFMEVLADAVSKGSGLGLGRLIEQSLSEKGPAAPPAERALPAPAATVPVPAVSSGFGPRQDPLDGVQRFHNGVDLRLAEGTPIRAAAGGVVRRAGERGGYGNAVELDHGNGVSTLYAHASALSVQAGETIEPGQALGWVGRTGHTTGAHLHFEVRVQGRPIDPKRALSAYGIRAEAESEGNLKQVSKLP